MDDALRDDIRRVAGPILEAEGAELVELIFHRHSGQALIRLLVDKVGGVTIQLCSRLNRLLGQALEEANVVDVRYTLEVSSPGLDRPLVSKRDFERAIGEELELEVRDETQSIRPVKGTLLSVQEEAVVITTRAGNVFLRVPTEFRVAATTGERRIRFVRM